MSISKEQKKKIREDIPHINAVKIEGVIVGLDSRLSEDEAVKQVEYANEQISNPESEFNRNRAIRQSRREAFDKRVAMARASRKQEAVAGYPLEGASEAE